VDLNDATVATWKRTIPVAGHSLIREYRYEYVLELCFSM
jgi:hypothetical protein